MSLFHSIKYNITDVTDYRQLNQLPPEILSRWEQMCFTLLNISHESCRSAKILGIHPVISRLMDIEIRKLIGHEDDGTDYKELCTQYLKRIIYEYEG